MASLAAVTVKSTFSGLLKTSDSGVRGAEGSADQLSDGAGNTIPLFVSATEVYAIGSGTGTSHTAFGKDCGVDLDAGTGNSLFGEGAGADVTNGEHNVAVGYHALFQGTTETDDNVAIGFNAMSGAIVTEVVNDCIAIGSGALSGDLDSTNGIDEASGTVAIGKSALAATTTGAGNVAIGYNALLENVSGANNIAIGYGAMDKSSNDPGSQDNVFIGKDSGGGTWAGASNDYNVAIGTGTMAAALNTSHSNVAIGYAALASAVLGNNNICIGKGAGQGIQDAANSVLIGSSAGDAITDMSGTVAIGYAALSDLDAGAQNTAIGYFAGRYATDAASSTFVGWGAGEGVSGTPLLGAYNTALGRRAGYKLQGAAHSNTLVGYLTGSEITTGADNVFMGLSTGDVATTGSHNTLIGTGANVDVATDAYQTRIGHYGALRYLTARIVLSDFTNAGTDNRVATTSLLTIPRYGFLKRVTCVVEVANGAGTGEFNISLGTSSVSVGGDISSGRVELIGADDTDNSDFTGATYKSSTFSADGDTQLNIELAKRLHIWEADQTTDDSSGWTLMEGQIMYLYVCHANTSNASHGTQARVRITAEYFGEA